MADKWKELETNLSKLSQARDRIAGQLEIAETKVAQLQARVNTELMVGESTNSLQELSLARERVTSLHQALQFGSSQVNEARQLLSDFDRAAQGGMIMDLDKKVQQAVVDLQDKIGAAGLKAEVDKLGVLIAEFERLSNSGVQVHGATEHLNTARSVHDRISRSLLVCWQDIEGLRWGPGHSTASNKPNYIPGFGVQPGYLTSE
jgi:hypothetical protein